jgi:hypothetical protein
MKKDLESRLRDALRPVSPDEQFTQRLIARVAAQPAATRSRRKPSQGLWWVSGIAASLIVGVGVQQHVHAQRELANGLEARRQVLQALALTSQKLDLAYATVKSQSSSLIEPESGA